jgi:hypothetical protein
METEVIKWDESMAQRCIVRYNAFHPQAWRGAEADSDEESSCLDAEEDDDSCWAEFSEKIKSLAAKK